MKFRVGLNRVFWPLLCGEAKGQVLFRGTGLSREGFRREEGSVGIWIPNNLPE